MKKLTTATDLGGAPIYKSDLRDLFNVDIWNVLDGIFSAQFGADVQGVILSGCVVTNNAGNFDMTAGIVYLNGSFMRVPAVTNQAFTQYIKADTVVNDSRIFADGSTHNVMINTPAICAAGIPGSGQYITISSLTSADAQRWGKVIDLLTSTNIIRGLSANQGLVLAAQVTAAIALFPTNVKGTFTTGSAGALETALTIARTANKNTRYTVQLISRRVSGSDAAGSGSSIQKTNYVSDLAGTGTLGTPTTIDTGSNTAGAPALTIAVSGANTLIQVQPGSATSYICYVSVWVMEI